MRILVIDNDININGLIKSVLSMEKDFETDFALSGKEGLRKLKSEKYDLVLVDLLMPEVSGFDICKFMSADEELKNTPAIIVSAMPINDKDYQRENGNFQNFPVVKDLVEKPFDVHELITKIRAAGKK
ncbi:MAG: response regulator [Candidatus Falkowbacteria bacterium]